MRLYGIAIPPEDCRGLVASLVADGSPDALAAAKTISRGLDLGAQLVALTTAKRDAILACLEDVQTPALGELRGALTPDRLARNG